MRDNPHPTCHRLGNAICGNRPSPPNSTRLATIVRSRLVRDGENLLQNGRPGFFRNDRFWLAPDHIVDPRVNHLRKEKAIIESCENVAKEMNLGDNYRPPSTTIMHTEFYRSRCQPGMLAIGADSHTCSRVRLELWQSAWEQRTQSFRS
jgi:hypothetical protein